MESETFPMTPRGRGASSVELCAARRAFRQTILTAFPILSSPLGIRESAGMLRRRRRVLIAILLAGLCGAGALRGAEEFEVGGPLAGLKLPDSSQNTGPGPEVELYPGSVEHFRAYFMKYLKVRSFFDRQSQLNIWTAPNIPGAEGATSETYASPVYRQPKNGRATATGEKLAPVPVVRFAANGPVFRLDLGTLDAGLYAVRVIGAVETAKLRDFRAPLVIGMRVNDGRKGETSTSRIRCGYVDEFYSVAELYFHAPERRVYAAEVFVDKASGVDLLVHHVSLDDVMAGTVPRAIKTRRTLTTDEDLAQIRSAPSSAAKLVAQYPAYSPEQRLARDEAIWRWLPPLNRQGLFVHLPLPRGVIQGVADQTLEQIEAEFGKWENAGGELGPLNAGLGTLDLNPARWNDFLVNKKLGLAYSLGDFLAGKPLPDPYPYKDDGLGLLFPDPKDSAKGRVFAPIARAAHARIRPAPCMAGAVKAWLQTGHRDLARDAAVDLVRYAYQLPAIDNRSAINHALAAEAFMGRDVACRQREMEQMWRSHYQNYLDALTVYDQLFDFIQGNEELAQSLHRFIPWVKTSQDVIRLLDQYLVQTTAKRILRYHTYTHPLGIAQAAATLGDRSVTDPWMEWLFDRTFIYPLAPAGVPDLLVSGCDQEGAQYIGSTYYAQGEGGRRMAAALEPYLRAGGNPKFDLGNPDLYPKTLAHCEWQLGITIAGQDFARIGDVCGPDKSPGATLGQELLEAARQGWRWSKNPRFAWILAHLNGRRGENDAEWKRIEEAAASVKRAPWLDLRSRVLANWFGALETGLRHDDPRFRRAAYVRAGVGYGHAHADTLDLQIVAHGLPMTVDGGQRSGYSKPNDRFSRIHNTVEVDGLSSGEYGLLSPATVRTLSDAEGARYLLASALPPRGAKLFQRQVALLDVDEGRGSQRLAAEQQRPGSALPQEVTTPNSYVFDVFRVSGGHLHTYCFHAMVQDDFRWNASNAKPVNDVRPARGQESENEYLKIFELAGATKEAGDCPATFEATWRYSRDGKAGSEQQMLKKNYADSGPRKFTRLALLGASGMRALKADVEETAQSPVKYRFTNVMLQRRAKDAPLESAFAAIIEPYAGTRFLASEKLLEVERNEADALRAIAVEVKMPNGRVDLCFADGRPEQERKIPAAACRISGEFGFLSRDARGVRQASLTGGTLLDAPGIRLAVAQRAHTGRLVEVDYAKKTLRLDAAWPAASAGRAFEVGAGPNRTTITSASLVPEGAGCRVTVTRSADFYRAALDKVSRDERVVVGALDLPQGRGNAEGMTLSNDSLTKTWRVERSQGPRFVLDGPVSPADFEPSKRIRLWAYGRGDPVRLPTFASVRRLDEGGWEVQGDADLEITIGSKTHKVAVADLARGPVRLPPP